MNEYMNEPQNEAQDASFDIPLAQQESRVCPYCGAPVRERFCGLCGHDTMQDQPNSFVHEMHLPPQMPPRRRLHTGLIISLTVLCVLSVFLFILTVSQLRLFSPSSPSVPEESQTPSAQQSQNVGGISAEEYAKIKKGMSYAHVSAIIGDDGVLADNGTTVQGETYYTYGWYGENNQSAEVYITFVNDAVSEITLNGEL